MKAARDLGFLDRGLVLEYEVKEVPHRVTMAQFPGMPCPELLAEGLKWLFPHLDTKAATSAAFVIITANDQCEYAGSWAKVRELIGEVEARERAARGTAPQPRRAELQVA